jgi:hypothetical protein
MSLLTCFFIWLCVSCLATPIIGVFLGALDSPEENRGNARSSESRLWADIDRIADRALAQVPAFISRFPRRRPMAADFALRTSRRMRR